MNECSPGISIVFVPIDGRMYMRVIFISFTPLFITENEVNREYVVDGLKQIIAVKGKFILPNIVPKVCLLLSYWNRNSIKIGNWNYELGERVITVEYSSELLKLAIMLQVPYNSPKLADYNRLRIIIRTRPFLIF